MPAHAAPRSAHGAPQDLAQAYTDPTFVFGHLPILGAYPETPKEPDMVIALILNIVLCAAVIVAVVTPLARAIIAVRPEASASLRRRQTAWTSTPAASRMRTPALGGSDR